jgi:hypothetical protein
MFCIYLRTNSDLCHLQHKLIGFYNRDKKCLQRGTDWGFKYSGLRFVFKWLNSQIWDEIEAETLSLTRYEPVNTLQTVDAHLRLYITTVQDG